MYPNEHSVKSLLNYTDYLLTRDKIYIVVLDVYFHLL